MSTPYVIAVDVGGTRLKSAAVWADGRLDHVEMVPVRVEAGMDYLLAALEAECRRVAAAVGHPPLRVGLALSGAIQPDFGVVLLPGKIKGLEGFPIVPRLAERLKWPVISDNDGRAAIAAEVAFGAAKGKRWAVTLTIGTGVGSGVLLDGRILHDPRLQFGTQIGHLILQAQDGRLCLTGARGTAETLCSATALALAVRDGLQRGIPSALTDLYWEKPHAIDVRAIAEAARAGDRLCLDEIRRWSEKLGWLVVTAIHAYAPEVVVLGGGAMLAGDLFLDRLRAQVAEHTYAYPPGDPIPLLTSAVGDAISVLGIGAIALNLLPP